jgi:hypothetical protein
MNLVAVETETWADRVLRFFKNRDFLCATSPFAHVRSIGGGLHSVARSVSGRGEGAHDIGRSRSESWPTRKRALFLNGGVV